MSNRNNSTFPMEDKSSPFTLKAYVHHIGYSSYIESRSTHVRKEDGIAYVEEHYHRGSDWNPHLCLIPNSKWSIIFFRYNPSIHKWELINRHTQKAEQISDSELDYEAERIAKGEW